MIPPRDALEWVRSQLRTELLGKLGDDAYARSVLISAIGVLGEVRARIAVDDAWCEPSVARFRAASARWPEPLAANARAAGSLAAERSAWLEATEEILTAQWALEPERRDAGLMAELRALVFADSELEAAHLGKRA